MLQAAFAIGGMLGGPVFAIFLMAFFNPWSEAIGVFVGYAVGNAIAIWCYIGSTQYPQLPKFTKALPTEISGCIGDFTCNATTVGEPWCPTPLEDDRSPLAEFYSISFLYVGTIGLVVTVFVGCFVSWLVYCKKKHSPNDLPPRVLFPPIDRMFPRNGKDCKNIEKELEKDKELSSAL